MIAALDPAKTEREIVDSLRRSRWTDHIAMPNFTPPDWWECDLFVLTRSGYFWEFEVKLSRSDFLRDAEKSREIRATGRNEPVPAAEARFPGQTRWVCDSERKHDLLARGDPRGPQKFFYVAPAGVLAPGDIPSWAGLIEVVGNGPNFGERTAAEFRNRKIHRAKADPKVRAYALETCYWRMHRLLR
jgi:hypothetical protein